MRIPTYVYKSRHGIYFFRIVVPLNLREMLGGRTEVRCSLHTRNLREAVLLARPLVDRYLIPFQRVRAIVSRTPPTVAELLEKAQKGELRDLTATQTVTLPNGQQHSYTIKTDSDSPQEIAAFERLEAKKQAELDAFVSLYRDKPVEVSEATRRIQEQETKEIRAYFAQLEAEKAARANAQAASTATARAQHAGDDNESFTFTPDLENTLSLRWAEYLALASAVDWTGPRTGPANKKKFEEFKNWWGKDEDIRAIDRPLINKFIVHLRTVRVVENGKRRGMRGLDERSVDNFTSVLNKFLTWAQDKGYFPDDRRLPTAKQTLVSKSARRKKSAKANPHYTPHQLRTIFDPKRYQFDLAHHWWPPLMALYTGGRRREICQMLVHDFSVIDGIPALSIDDLGDDDKSIKSFAARRTIPVHPMLIELGLLDYVEDVTALGLGPELFPGISVNKYGEKGAATGTAWGRHLKACGVVGNKVPTFHSFRATAIDILKAKGVSFDMRCQLVGHENPHVSEDYNPNKFTVAKLMELGVPKLIYEGLDLSGLRYQRGRFDVSNRHEAVKAAKREADIAARKAQAEAEAQKELAPARGTAAKRALAPAAATEKAPEKKPFTIKITRKRKPSAGS